MDVAKTVEDMVKKLKLDKVLAELFTKDPVKAIEKTLGIKLPDDQMKAIADGVKAKLSADKAGEALGAITGLFGKNYS